MESDDTPSKKEETIESAISSTLPSTAPAIDITSPSSETKRHVRFPSDVVSSYFEPPDLWPKDVRLPTSQQLFEGYVKACERYGAKPLQKLIDQLLAIDLQSNRWAPAISLRGERLDAPQIESMEEILRWVRFRIFDISDTMLADESATALFDMLEFYGRFLNTSYYFYF